MNPTTTRAARRRRSRPANVNPDAVYFGNPKLRTGHKWKNHVTAVWATPMGNFTIVHGFDARNSRRAVPIRGSAAQVDARWFFELCMTSATCVGAHLVVNGISQGGRDGPAS